jgi:hypothetical protein
MVKSENVIVLTDLTSIFLLIIIYILIQIMKDLFVSGYMSLQIVLYLDLTLISIKYMC